MDKASTTETVDSASIPSWVKQVAIKLGIHSFPSWRSASLHRVW